MHNTPLPWGEISFAPSLDLCWHTPPLSRTYPPSVTGRHQHPWLTNPHRGRMASGSLGVSVWEHQQVLSSKNQTPAGSPDSIQMQHLSSLIRTMNPPTLSTLVHTSGSTPSVPEKT